MNIESSFPDFLLVGAAKSGTTSLFNYLVDHPEIHEPKIKEPGFINSHFLKHSNDNITVSKFKDYRIKDLSEYLKLFKKEENEKISGEASVGTLYHYQQSIPVIKKYREEPKIIIILRNPIERAFSAYSFLKLFNSENLSFQNALDFEEEKIAKNWPSIWHYKNMGNYFEQVNAFMENFQQVKIILFENFLLNKNEVIKDLYDFLEVDPNYIPKNLNTNFNASGIPKNELLNNIARKNFGFQKYIKYFLPLTFRKRIGMKIDSMNLIKNKMSQSDRKYLNEYYSEDINKLQNLLKIDLSNWQK